MINRKYCEKSCPRERVQGDGERIATASVRTGLAMTGVLHGVRYKAGRVVREADPYGSVTGRASGIGRGRTPSLRRVIRSAVKRGVGEIGEAPPVAEEAS